MSEKKLPKLLLIDGHSMAFRAFFALPADKFITSSGQHTNAVHGFVSMLLNLIKNEEPTHIAVAFDAGSTTFRTKQFTEYKANRAATPEEFKSQVPLIKEVLQAMNIHHLEKDQIEADDILGTLSKQADELGMEVLISSGDRDILQFVNENITVLYPVKGVSELARMTPQAVFEKYGLQPAQYPDMAALVGETSDNIPGVPGVGPKTAVKWINQYGDLENIIDHAEEIGGKVGQTFRENIEQVKLNRQINRLLTDVELPLGVSDLAVVDWNLPEIETLFDALQFKTLRDRALKLVGANASNNHDISNPVSEFKVDLLQLGTSALEAWLEEGTTFGIEIEGIRRAVNADCWKVAIAKPNRQAVAFDLEVVDPELEQVLGAFFADGSKAKVFHGAKSALHALSARRFVVAGLEFDTELAAYVCQPDRRDFDFDAIAPHYLDFDLVQAHEVADQGELDLVLGGSVTPLLEPLALRAAAIVELAQVLAVELENRAATKLYREIELPLVENLYELEKVGVSVNEDKLQELLKQFQREIQVSAEAAYDTIGRTVNLGSPKQLQEVLFTQLEMPKTKAIKTGYTTDAKALGELFDKTRHPFLEHLLAHRDATKLKQTVEGLMSAIAEDSRIHSTFQQTVAATGRLSSVDPNLQNIPIRTTAGREIRKAFVVGAGYESLLTADYSQIEMRIMAHLSGDAGLIEAYESGEDLHNYVGARVFGVPATEVTSEQRARVKAMSYGLAYGLSAFGLSKQLGISRTEADDLMTDYYQRFSGVRDYLASVVKDARLNGYTETILGRRRYLPDLTSDNRQRREMAERMALNAPIQGSSADIIKVAMLAVDAKLRSGGLKSRLLLQVHDELIIEIWSGELEQVTDIVRREMENAVSLRVPLGVSVGVGENWYLAGH